MGSDFAPFAARMRSEALPEVAIRTFRYYYEQLVSGASGTLSRAEIEPVQAVPDAAGLGDAAQRGHAALAHTVVIKLNGGLGTSMGMTRAKSLLPAKGELCFLDVIARQILELRRAHGCRIPLVLMDSFRTRQDSLQVLARYPELAGEVPADFLQHKVPRIRADDLQPIEWPAEPEYEWAPPGHGDLYTALVTSGMLRRLREVGCRYAFVSNADNLGAVLDVAILGWFAAEGAPFAMEVCERTQADRKGGHLARLRDGRLTLRESAQCPPDELESFQDVSLYRYFNTNNLWLDLAALERVLEERGGILGLPLIRNEKPVDPRDPDSPRVIQLETALGAAISVFAGARALRVPRARFAPVKTASDLLAVWSDAYELDGAWRVTVAPARRGEPPLVELDPAFYRTVDDLRLRFPAGAPSLVGCRWLSVRGDVRFGRDVVCRGDVELVQPGGAPLRIPDGALLGA